MMFDLRVSSFVFLVRALCSQCFCLSLSCFLYVCVCKKVHEDWPFTKSAKQPAPIRCVLWNCLSRLWSFGYICFEICRFESPFWMPRCYPKFPISGTPSAGLHLPISHTCYSVYGAHKDEDLGGYYWLCLRVWLRRRDSYFDALPLLPPARSATFQPNDHRSCCLWRWSQGVLTWSQRLYHGENLATGQGCSCLSDFCIQRVPRLDKEKVLETFFIFSLFFHFDHPAVASGWGIFTASCCNRSKLHLDSLSWPFCSPSVDRWLCSCHTDWWRERSESELGRFGCPCFQRPGIRRRKGWDWYFESRWRLQRKLSLVSLECP